MSLLCDNCKNERCNDRWKCHIISCPSYTEKPKQTNADRIRAMTDEELAKWISCGAGMSVGVCGYCKNSEMPYCDGLSCAQKTDAQIILEWLQQPAEGD